LEETYAKWQLQSVTVPRYTHFPFQTNLTEIIDKTEIQDEGILEFFSQRKDANNIEMTNSNPVSALTKVQSSYKHVDKNSPVHRKESHSNECSTPVSQETRTPRSNRRKAAENAMTKLHNEIMPDVLLWEKEKNRKRIPEEKLSDEVEKKKVEKRKMDEKENLVEGVSKKVKKEAEGKNVTDNKITLLVTGASEDFINANSVKV